MGFDYLNGKKWKDISRDERRFCADLVFQLEKSGKQKEFVQWINHHCNLNINDTTNFEIDFEVCFYRDLIFDHELEKTVNLEGKKEIKGLLKRTFDICIFLPNDIIIVEAKVAQGMTNKQMMEFKYDKQAMMKCLNYLTAGNKIRIHIVGLVSKLSKKLKDANEEHNYFDKIITWNDIEGAKLEYYQPKKLRTAYKETSDRKNWAPMRSELIKDLAIITNEMQHQIKNLKEE